jgi:hypothetical protein
MKYLLARRSFVAAIVTVIAGYSTSAQAGKWFTAEILNDACSGDIVIKVPYTEPNAPSLDDNDIILARSPALCALVEGSSPGGHKGVCGTGKFTKPILYSDIKNNEGRFRWFCGTTAERSRCTKGTGRIQSRLGKDRLFRTLCQKWDPTQ